MNVLDHVVLKVLSKPYQINDAWFVDVLSDCYGSEINDTVVKFSKEEIEEVKPGYKYLA
jgi:hypothetical protein